RHIHWMAYSGVFWRHPDLRVIITEIPGDWLPAYLDEIDGPWFSAIGAEVREGIDELPSEAVRRCVFGAWWLGPHETTHAVTAGLEGNLIWGSDYPHIE